MIRFFIKPDLSNAVFFLAIIYGQFCIANPNVTISHINDVTHLEFPSELLSDYSVSQKGNVVEIRVEALPPAAVSFLKEYTDQLISGVDVQRSSSLNKDVIKIRLSKSNIQTFDYLTDSPQALSIDFYIDDQISQKKITKAESDSGDQKRKIASDEFVKLQPETVDPAIDGPRDHKKKNVSGFKDKVRDESFDLLGFDINKLNFKSDSLIENRGKIFLKFPMLQSDFNDFDEVLKKKVNYEIEEDNSKEAKQAKQLKEKFDSGNYRDFLKERNKFLSKYPRSKFSLMFLFMQADAVYQMAREDKSLPLQKEALKIYDAIVNKYPESPLTERTLLFISLARTQLGDVMMAIRSIKQYQKQFPQSPLNNSIDLLLARNYMNSEDADSALKIYEKLSNSPNIDIKKQAMFNLGDVFFKKKEYIKAIRQYQLAEDKFPNDKQNYASAIFNKAESQFLIEDYKLSLENFRNFYRYHIRHSYSQYALTRMGEIFEIIGEDGGKWRGFYNESYFRYRETTGGSIARSHLLFHQIGSTESKKIEPLVQELNDLQKKINLPQSDEYITFLLSDAYYDRGEYELATKELIQFYKKMEKPVYFEKFQKRIGRGIAAQIRSALEKNQTQVAFDLFNKYDEFWFKKADRADFVYLKAMTFEQAQIFETAIVEYEKYIKFLKENGDLKYQFLGENLPNLDEVKMRLSVCQLKIQQYTHAEKTLEDINISNINEHLQDEYFLEKSILEEKKNNLTQATNFVDKIKHKNFVFLDRKIDLLMEQEKFKSAVSVIDDYLDKNNLNQEQKFSLLKKKLINLEKSGISQEKINLFYEKFYEEFKTSNLNFDEIKYKLGMQYEMQNRKKDAESVFSSISENSMWKSLAEESLKEKKWNDQYKKYMDRIPAMVDEKKGSRQ